MKQEITLGREMAAKSEELAAREQERKEEEKQKQMRAEVIRKQVDAVKQQLKGKKQAAQMEKLALMRAQKQLDLEKGVVLVDDDSEEARSASEDVSQAKPIRMKKKPRSR